MNPMIIVEAHIFAQSSVKPETYICQMHIYMLISRFSTIFQ